MGMYLVGIDGGGTSCRARIKDSQGNFLGEAKSGSANIMLGAEIAMASILESITSGGRARRSDTTRFRIDARRLSPCRC